MNILCCRFLVARNVEFLSEFFLKLVAWKENDKNVSHHSLVIWLFIRRITWRLKWRFFVVMFKGPAKWGLTTKDGSVHAIDQRQIDPLSFVNPKNSFIYVQKHLKNNFKAEMSSETINELSTFQAVIKTLKDVLSFHWNIGKGFPFLMFSMFFISIWKYFF